jgi:hypothetical protein
MQPEGSHSRFPVDARSTPAQETTSEEEGEQCIWTNPKENLTIK